jgi:GNAT superfamily N-acetyltransferase
MDIRRATTDPELEELLAIRNAVWPRHGYGLRELHLLMTQVREIVMFVARDGSQPVGAADAGLLAQSPEPFAHAWVLPSERRRGIGSELYGVISAYVKSRGKDVLEAWVEDCDLDGAEFVRNRGFTEIGREIRVTLDLTGIEAPEVDVPEGIEIVPWAERPELIHGIYEVAIEASADIPGDEEDEIEPFDRWVAHEMDAGPGERGPEATFVAVAGDEVVGYSKFSVRPGRSIVAHHDLTGVKRAWRRRGIARALKQTQIAWAKREGFERLETQNEERNERIRKLNAELGYERSGIRMLFRGPLCEDGS